MFITTYSTSGTLAVAGGGSRFYNKWDAYRAG